MKSRSSAALFVLIALSVLAGANTAAAQEAESQPEQPNQLYSRFRIGAGAFASFFNTNLRLDSEKIPGDGTGTMGPDIKPLESSMTGYTEHFIGIEGGAQIVQEVELPFIETVSEKERRLRQEIAKVIAGNPDQVKTYRSGKETVIGWFVGQVMRETKGKANPLLVQELLGEMLTGE